MSPKNRVKSSDREVITRYTDQPAVMSAELRDRIEAQWTGQTVQLYAVADLDSSMKLHNTWVVLGASHVAIVYNDGSSGNMAIKSFTRSRIDSIRVNPGLSCTTMTFLDSETDAPLAVVRYTHRQRRAMENLKFVLEHYDDGQIPADCEADEMYTSSMLHDIKEAQASFSKHNLSVLWRLLSYLKPYKTRMLLGMLAATVLTLITLLPPQLTGYLIDNVVMPMRSGSMPADQAKSAGMFVVLIIAAIYLMRPCLMWVRLRTMAVLGEFIARDLRHDLYSHIQSLSLSFFSSKRTGSIISRVSSDTDRIWDFIAFGVVEVSLSIIMLIGIAIFLLIQDFYLGLALAIPVPIFLYAIFKHGQRMMRLFLRVWRKWSHMTDVLSDTIPGMRVVKAFNQEEYEKGRFKKRNNAFFAECNNVHSSWTTFWPAMMLCMHMMTLVVWWFAVPRLLRPEDAAGALAPGRFISILLYVGMFFHPIEVVGQMARMLNRATSSAYRIFEVMDTEPQVVESNEAVKFEPLQGRVTFENVSFAYDGIRRIIRGVSFDVKKGEMIGLVGPSGAGKSTITNLIARFYDVTDGRILIDGVDIQKLDTGHFRKQIGMVLQEPFLFHGTIVENIRYGLPEATTAQVVEAAIAANAHDFICKLTHGYDTVVGERGHTLSGGERQRVSIARAILNNPRILILDEATSSVDTETERNIQEALDRLIAGRTVFAVAHRLSTLTRADRLFVIEDGRITEQGTHEELLGREDGTYRKLSQMQQELHEMYAV